MANQIYVAGGWFDKEQMAAIKELEELFDIDSFRPRLDTKHLIPDWDAIYNENIKHLSRCDMVIASTIGKDMGTLWECGYACALNIEVIYYTPGISRPNLMLGKSGIICSTIEEVYAYVYDGILPLAGTDYE